jgi:hypothetical protein
MGFILLGLGGGEGGKSQYLLKNSTFKSFKNISTDRPCVFNERKIKKKNVILNFGVHI